MREYTAGLVDRDRRGPRGQETDPETETEVFNEGMELDTEPVQSAPPGKKPAGPPFRRGTIPMLPVTGCSSEFRSALCLPVWLVSLLTHPKLFWGARQNVLESGPCHPETLTRQQTQVPDSPVAGEPEGRHKPHSSVGG